jgi:hypothetical protein
MAAAEVGSKVSETSMYAAVAPCPVRPARKERTSVLLPEYAGPTISVTPPSGNPPPSSASTSAMPVGSNSGEFLGGTDRAAGIRIANIDSICSRRATADGMIYSPFVRYQRIRMSRADCQLITYVLLLASSEVPDIEPV